MSEMEDMCKTLVDEWWEAYIATMVAYDEECRQATVEWEKFNRLLNRIESDWRKYFRTGIKPKYQNRTRKKQRLTRLQRRWKRQRK